MSDFLENVDYIYKFNLVNGFNTVKTNLKSSSNFRDGVNHMIGYMRNHTNDFTGVTAFEYRYNDDILNTADVMVNSIKYEFKSWTPNIPNPWNSFFAGTNGSYSQFISYLQNTNSISELKYIFNGTKAPEAQVKQAFKELFIAKKSEIFGAMSAQLKTNLNISSIEDLTDNKIELIINSLIKSL
jgi:hypothetical protein